MTTPTDLPSVNGVPLARDDESPAPEALRQRACTELLRQAAMRAGLLDADDPAPVEGATSEAAARSIEALLDREIVVPDPSEEACRRHHAANSKHFASGERVHARHVLFAVTPGVDIALVRMRAEDCLFDLRCQDAARATEAFAAMAAEFSNCPSGAHGGDLGWLTANDCAPEFARALFGGQAIGVLPHLVATRFGLHVIEVLAREGGEQPPFEAVHAAVAQALRQQSYVTALRQYLGLLTGAARIEGIDMDAATAPLVQ
ncbi:peptidylprolyl isomerase [Variovorax ureilyticus]|uniref:peptidylprolyl isomerase n=1 Tax=Variovorax ureilyticus TaxID=1836198 RepID=A0ABU8VF19_9BURK